MLCFVLLKKHSIINMTSQSSEPKSAEPGPIGQEFHYDHLLKLLIVGDSGVGKSALLTQFAERQFHSDFITTIGIDFKIKTCRIPIDKPDNDYTDLKGHKDLKDHTDHKDHKDPSMSIVKIQLWDTAGQVRFRPLIPSYYNSVDAILIAYSIKDPESFASVINSWLPAIFEEAMDDKKHNSATDNSDTEKLLNWNAPNLPNSKTVKAVQASRKIPLVFVVSTKHDVGFYKNSSTKQAVSFGSNQSLHDTHTTIIDQKYKSLCALCPVSLMSQQQVTIPTFATSSKQIEIGCLSGVSFDGQSITGQNDFKTNIVEQMFFSVCRQVIRLKGLKGLKGLKDLTFTNSANYQSYPSDNSYTNTKSWYQKICCCLMNK